MAFMVVKREEFRLRVSLGMERPNYIVFVKKSDLPKSAFSRNLPCCDCENCGSCPFCVEMTLFTDCHHSIGIKLLFPVH